LPTLKPEYAELLRRVDLEERSVPEAAAEVGITPNNAGVRLHRARQALKHQLERSCGSCATHGCLDCSCQRA
jgi:RNA polymerase sigma-70 factor (ECF subfamily)